jgi:uncharacterized membrane protein YhaH (DUF805 family)
MDDLLGELFDPHGRIGARTFGWRAGFYCLAAVALALAILIACAIGRLADLRPLTPGGRAVGFALLVLPFTWMHLVNAIRRLRDAGGGYLSLIGVLAIGLAILAFDAWLWINRAQPGDWTLTLGLALYLNLALATLWVVYAFHLATMPSRGARPDLPPLFPEFMPPGGQVERRS